jgi:uncharacterized protein (TIGR02246 family)
MLTAEHPTQAIPNGNAEFMKYFAAGDAEGIASLYTSTGRILPPGAPAMDGREAIAAFWRGAMDMGLTTVELRTASIEVSGLDTAEAIAIETGEFTLGAGDGSVAGTGKYLVAWQCEDGRWGLHRDIWNMDPAS